MTKAQLAVASQSPTKHVVHLISTLESGGVQNVVLGLAGAKAMSGYRHSVICLAKCEGELASRFEAAGIGAESCGLPHADAMRLPSYRLSRWLSLRLEALFPMRLRFRLRRLRADLVHSHISRRIDLQASAILLKVSLPWVWTIHGLMGPDGADPAQWRRAAGFLAEGRGCITADSGALVEDLAAHGVGRRESVRLVHASADVERFLAPQGPRNAEWRRRYGIPEDAVVFGTAGRLVRLKGYDVFARAAAILGREGIPAHFVVAGTGSLRDSLQDLIRELGLDDRFHLVGFQEDMPAVLRQFDVFVLPSRAEGFPLALIEALASGRPCVAARVGGVPEMLGEDGGLMVPPESPEELAAAMRTMLDPDARERFARRAPALSRAFSHEVSATQFAEIYRSLLA